MYAYEHYEGTLGKFDYSTHDFVVTNMSFIAKASCAVAKVRENDDTIDSRELMLRFMRLQAIDSRIKVTEDELMMYLSDDNVDYKSDCLCYVGNFEKTIRLPEGCISTKCMFTSRVIPSDIKLEGFDKGTIVNTSHMFEDADLSNIHNFGKLNIRTNKVTDMRAMFSNCILGRDFDFGPKFTTIRVTNMYAMFRSATLAGYIDVCFNTPNVTCMREMFAAIDTSNLESLTLDLDTSNCIDMIGMFFNINTRNNKHMILDLGENFDTSRVIDMSHMFEGSALHDNFYFGNKFVFDSVRDVSYMFADAILPENFYVTADIMSEHIDYRDFVFEGARYPSGLPFDENKAMSNSNVSNVKQRGTLSMADIFGI